MTPQRAAILGLEALGWLAGNAETLDQFLGISGADREALRAGADSADMQLAVIEFLLEHEDLLLGFCEDTDTKPQAMHLARHVLGGPVV
jgi:hypothetical protein